MHFKPTCINCKHIILEDIYHLIYKCCISGCKLYNENVYDNTCLYFANFEEKDDKTMLKHFCDICKKELKADEETFIFTIETSGDDPTYDSCHEEVCKDCRKQIEDYIDYLAYVKYKDGTKQ